MTYITSPPVSASDRFVRTLSLADREGTLSTRLFCHPTTPSTRRDASDCVLDALLTPRRQAVALPLWPSWTTPTATPTSASKRRRYISINPEKILDAPGIVGDFYMDILSWSADGSLAVGLQHQVYLWKNGTTTSLIGHRAREAVTAVAFSALPARPDLLAGFDDGSLVQVDVGQKKVVATTSFHGGQRVSAVTTYGSDLIISGDSGGCIALWDVRQFGSSKRPAHCLPEHTHGGDIICTARSSFDGLYLATGGNNNTFAVWDIRNLGAQPVFSKSGIDGHQSAVRAIAWSPWQRNLLVTAGGSNDGFIKMWDAYSALKLGQRSTGSQITNVIVAPHHRELITSHGFASLSVGARQARGAAVPSPALSAAPAQPSRRPTRDANHLCIWSYPSLETVWKTCPAAHDDRVLFMALSPDGETVATAAADENVKIWRVFGESDRTLLTTAAAAKKEDVPRQLSHSWKGSRNASVPVLDCPRMCTRKLRKSRELVCLPRQRARQTSIPALLSLPLYDAQR